jgi:integrase
MGLYRRKQDGSLYWWASYTIGGRRIRESTKTSDREEAKRFLAERVVGNSVPVKSSISYLLDALVTDYEVNGKSFEWCSQNVEKHIRPFFGDIKAERLDKATIKFFMKQKLDEGYANATINRCIALLHRAFTLADCKFPRIEKLQENNVRKGFVDESRFFALYERLPQHQRPIALFAFETGCRKSEVLALKWDQIDVIRRMVRLNPGETKNKEGRVIPLSDMMMWLLTKKLPHVSEYVFTYRGKRLKSIKQGWGDAQEDLPETFLFHDLRRSAIRNMVRSGVPERVAMAVSGHKTRSVFDRYNIVDEDDLTNAMKSMMKGRKTFMYDPTRAPELSEYIACQNAVGDEAGTLQTGLDPEIIDQLASVRPPSKKKASSLLNQMASAPEC